MPATADQAAALGSYLREARQAAGLSLRAVEGRTDGKVKNAYLSQIEHGDIKRPSTDVLYALGDVYGLDYADLLQRAGHPVPDAPTRHRHPAVIAGMPTEAFTDLSDAERSQVLDFVAYLRSRRREGSARPTP